MSGLRHWALRTSKYPVSGFRHCGAEVAKVQTGQCLDPRMFQLLCPNIVTIVLPLWVYSAKPCQLPWLNVNCKLHGSALGFSHGCASAVFHGCAFALSHDCALALSHDGASAFFFGCAFAWSHGWIGFLTRLCICFCMALHLLSHGSAFALSHGCAADLFNGSAVAIHTWLCSCFITWLCICFISWLHICFVTRLCIGSFCAFAFSHGSAFASLQSHETLQSVNVQMKRESKRIFWNKPS